MKRMKGKKVFRFRSSVSNGTATPEESFIPANNITNALSLLKRDFPEEHETLVCAHVSVDGEWKLVREW